MNVRERKAKKYEIIDNLACNIITRSMETTIEPAVVKKTAMHSNAWKREREKNRFLSFLWNFSLSLSSEKNEKELKKFF